MSVRSSVIACIIMARDLSDVLDRFTVQEIVQALPAMHAPFPCALKGVNDDEGELSYEPDAKLWSEMRRAAEDALSSALEDIL